MTQEQTGSVSAAELEMYIAGVKFPADKDTIIGHVTREGAPAKVIEFIDQAPNKTYETVADLAVGTTASKH